MLPFLGKDEATLRRLESQLQQRECQVSNVEASLAKSKAETEKLKSDIDQLRHALREANAKALHQEQQLERYNKELKPKKEMCTWLQEQVTYLKKELETKSAKEKEVANKVHHKTEEMERLRAELQGVRRELDHAKVSLQSTDVHASRFRGEAESEITRLRSEVASKTQTIKMLEDAVQGKEWTDEQREQLQKASLYDQLSVEMKEVQSELRGRKEQIQKLEGQLHEAEFVKKELEKLKEQNQHLMQECQRLGEGQDEGRLYRKKVEELETERKSMSEAMAKLEEKREMQNQRMQEMTMQLEAKEMKGEGFQASVEKLQFEVEEREQKLSGIQVQCERLQEENNKLYEHIHYTEEQLNRAKDVIDAKQGILENARAMNEGDKKHQESVGKLIQSLRSELHSSRNQIAELTTKDKKAGDAIQALERKIEHMRAEAAQAYEQNQYLDKELKSSQVEVLRVQQQLNAMTEKMALYKIRLSSLREEISENEKGAQEQGAQGNRLRKCPEYYTLQERVKMLEEEIVAERNSHSVTKDMLRQESEHCALHEKRQDEGKGVSGVGAAHSGTTLLSTPFPVPGSNFRFSYCRPDPAHRENETPSLTLGQVSVTGDRPVTPTEAVAMVENTISRDHISLTPVTEAMQKPETDEGAMDVDVEITSPPSLGFSTPGPTLHRTRQDSQAQQHQDMTHAEESADFHQLSTKVYQDFERQKSHEK